MKRIQASRYVGGSVRRRRIPATPAADTGAALAQRKAEVASLFAELWAETVSQRPEPASGEAEAPAATEAPAPAPEAAPAPAGPARNGSLFIDHTVRSGQSVTFPEGDVTVIGSVSSGAEIVAGGSIHVYGALRGRALAGVGGNADARIICHSLEAELLVIDGLYRVADEIDPALRNRPAQIRLEGAVMTVTALD